MGVGRTSRRPGLAVCRGRGAGARAGRDRRSPPVDRRRAPAARRGGGPALRDGGDPVGTVLVRRVGRRRHGTADAVADRCSACPATARGAERPRRLGDDLRGRRGRRSLSPRRGDGHRRGRHDRRVDRRRGRGARHGRRRGRLDQGCRAERGGPGLGDVVRRRVTRPQLLPRHGRHRQCAGRRGRGPRPARSWSKPQFSAPSTCWPSARWTTAGSSYRTPFRPRSGRSSR